MIRMSPSPWVSDWHANAFLGPIRAVAASIDEALDSLEEKARAMGANWILALEMEVELHGRSWSAVGTAARCTPRTPEDAAAEPLHRTTTPTTSCCNEDSAS